MKPLTQINFIPFIDVMLVLLAVVLTTATFVAQGRIQVNLPGATQVKPVSWLEHMRITIDASGGIYLDGEALTLEELDARTAALAPSLNRSKGDTRFLLHVDERVAFRHFVAVVDLLKKYNIEDISIVAKQL